MGSMEEMGEDRKQERSEGSLSLTLALYYKDKMIRHLGCLVWASLIALFLYLISHTSNSIPITCISISTFFFTLTDFCLVSCRGSISQFLNSNLCIKCWSSHTVLGQNSNTKLVCEILSLPSLSFHLSSLFHFLWNKPILFLYSASPSSWVGLSN